MHGTTPNDARTEAVSGNGSLGGASLEVVGPCSSDRVWQPSFVNVQPLERPLIAEQGGGDSGVVWRSGGQRVPLPFLVRCKDVAVEPSANRHVSDLDHFADALLENKTIITPAEMGRRDNRMMDAIYHAARTGEPVELNADATMKTT